MAIFSQIYDVVVLVRAIFNLQNKVEVVFLELVGQFILIFSPS